MGMAISLGPMHVCLHPPQVSPRLTVMAGRCPDGQEGLEPGPILILIYNDKSLQELICGNPE